MNAGKIKKAALAASMAALLAAGSLAVLFGERYINANPLPVSPASAQNGYEETEPEVGSTDGLPVRFSVDSGFYSSTQYLGLYAEGAEKILYTRDGTDPRTGGRQYKKEITLRSPASETESYTISACAVYPDGSFSEPVTRSYICGGDISNRFDCLVFSITTDPDNLYNYEDGIFIAGKMRDDYLATNPTREIQPTDPANWNQRGMAGERPAHVEVFEYDGSCVISQDCGLRIFGGWSRSNDQKNLKLYARSEYDETNNRFRYEFFPNASDSQGNKIVSYKKLALRACANDAGYLYARDDAISALAEATGIEVKKSRPAAVFLNGEYYGFAWLQQVFSEDLLDHKYNVEEKNPGEEGCWDIIKGCEYMMIEDEDDPDWAEKNAAWREMYDYAYKDLTDDKNFEELSQLIDIDNFLTYYALNSYIGNGDWPNNNYKVFRYTGGIKDDENPVFDGRWRFMLYDTDFALGLYNTDFLSSHIKQLFKEENFGIMPQDWRDDVHDKGDMYYKRSDLLISLCKRDDIRERFVDILCAISGYYFNAERTAAYLDEYHEMRLHELVAASENGKANVWSVAGELERCKDWIDKRPYSARLQLASIFPDNYEKSSYFTVKYEPVDGAKVNIGAAKVVPGGAGYDGWFFNGTEVKLSCELEQGAKFLRWEINGETVTEPETTVSFEKYGEFIKIELYIEQNAGIKIEEAAYKASAGGDFVVLKNYSSTAQTTSGMTLSDGDNSFILPTLNLAAGQSIKIIGKNYTKFDALGAVECDFNLKEGETVSLISQSGKELSSVFLRPAHRRTSLSLDPYTGLYNESPCSYKDRILEAELPQWGNWGW